MEHTPGPWVVGITFDRGWPTYRLRDMIHKAETEGFSAEMQANARLIAAAPRLLERAQMAMNELCFGGDWETARKLLGEAIAKATGGE